MSDATGTVTRDMSDHVREQNRVRKQRQRHREKMRMIGKCVTNGVTSGGLLSLADESAAPFFAQPRNYDGIVNAIRRRRELLGLTQLEVDEIAGTQTGYCGKIERPSARYGKVMGEMSFQLIMQALGLQLVVTDAGLNRVLLERTKVGANRRGSKKKGKR